MTQRNWRWWFRVIHRDLGYLCVGLTLVYAISGVAVNHVRDWNPSYSIQRLTANVGPVELESADDAALAREVLARLELPADYKTLFVPGPGQLRILRENHTIDIDLASGALQHEIVTPRPVLQQANFLHLNHPKRAWTWVADIFAVALVVLAISGIFLIKGKKGITGRGMWLTLAGCALPLAFLWLYG